jgi:MarR family multiple antibiotic resistance transcriptional regulator
VTQRMLEAEDAWRALSNTSKKVWKTVNTRLAEMDVSVIEAKVMFMLKKERRAPMARLSTELMITPAGATMVADRLEARGLIRRVRSIEDRRVVNVELTRRGEAKLEKAIKVYNDVIQKVFNGLSHNEVELLISITDKINALLESSTF